MAEKNSRKPARAARDPKPPPEPAATHPTNSQTAEAAAFNQPRMTPIRR